MEWILYPRREGEKSTEEASDRERYGIYSWKFSGEVLCVNLGGFSSFVLPSAECCVQDGPEVSESAEYPWASQL